VGDRYPLASRRSCCSPSFRMNALSSLLLLSFPCLKWLYMLLMFGWVVASAVGSVGVWGVWVGPGLVWMGCGVFAVALLWGGRLLAADHQSSNAVRRCW
jgi:hypothetical protein